MTDLVSLGSAPGLVAARQQLRTVGRAYAARRAATVLLPAAAAALLLAGLAGRWPAARPALLALAGLGLLALAWQLWPLRKLRPAATAAALDRQSEELEDSAGLLVRDTEELNLLEQLQQQRVARRLNELRAADKLRLPVSFRRAGLLTGLLLLAGAGAYLLPAGQKPASSAGVALRFLDEAPPPAPGQVVPKLLSTELLVTSPSYTRQPAFRPAQASFACAEGARVRWQVLVQDAGRTVPQLELGRLRLRLRPVAGRANVFFTEQILTSSVLYRLRLGRTVSDDYAIEVRPDQAPVLRILTPKTYTLVEFGQPSALPVRASARDDYGLRQAELVITIAQGEGEAVKFREVRRDLSAGLAGQPAQTSLLSQLDLPRLGLTYGDELYFYLSARDNAGHLARTDAYLVQWQDTAVDDSALDVGMGVKVAPAYFRSQRQIIIDTEKLIADQPKLDAATLAGRANDLGFDQQALRLRYGKFMGEEKSAGLGATAPRAPIAEDEEASPSADAPAAAKAEKAEEHHADDGHDHSHGAGLPTANASPTAATDALMEAYVHRHDDSETADFLEPAVKAKLRAVLDQMWAAELRLRTGQLRAALPYEYRALRLLKQVQQQTRAYVKKAGFVLPPLPEASLRLSGELKGAVAPQRRLVRPVPAAQPALRAALRWLARTATAAPPRPPDARLLEPAGPALAAAALRQPGRYLPALRALRALVADVRAGRRPCAGCRLPVERALTDLLAAPAPHPVPPPAADRLARRYFQELSR